MNLIDLLRQNTKELRDTLSEIDKVRAKHVTDRNAAEERFKRASSEISSHHKQFEEKKGLLSSIELVIRDINRQIDELDIKRQKLLNDLQEKQQELDGSKRSISLAEEQANKAQRSIREEKKRLEDIQRHLDDIENQKERYQNSLSDQHKQTLFQYLNESSRLLEQQLQAQSSRSESLRSLEALKRQRHERRDVADLCDARDEWKRILKTAAVPAVKDAAQAELHKIETQIENLFPDALKAESVVKHSDYIEELYYFVDTLDRTVILIPISPPIWKSLADGKQSSTESIALYLAASIGKALDQPPDELEFDCDDKFVTLICKGGKSVLQDKNDITISLLGGGSIAFILSSLPTEIQEALSK